MPIAYSPREQNNIPRRNRVTFVSVPLAKFIEPKGKLFGSLVRLADFHAQLDPGLRARSNLDSPHAYLLRL